MNLSILFVLLSALFVHSLSLATDHRPISNITVIGTVYCDTCSNNRFSNHSYFLKGVEVSVNCKFRLNPKSKRNVSISVKRTTDKHGAYKLDIPVLHGFRCREGHETKPICRASLQRNPSSLCDIPSLRISTEHLAIRVEQARCLCVYNLNALSYRPSKELNKCGGAPLEKDAISSDVNSSEFFWPPFIFPFPFPSPPSFPFPFPFPYPPSFPFPIPSPPTLPFPTPPTFPFPFPPPPSFPFPIPSPPTLPFPPSPPTLPFPPFPPIYPSPPSFPFPFPPSPPLFLPPSPPPPSFPFPFTPFPSPPSVPSPPFPPLLTPPPPSFPFPPFPSPPLPPFTPFPSPPLPPYPPFPPIFSPPPPPSLPYPFPPLTPPPPPPPPGSV